MLERNEEQHVAHEVQLYTRNKSVIGPLPQAILCGNRNISIDFELPVNHKTRRDKVAESVALRIKFIFCDYHRLRVNPR